MNIFELINQVSSKGIKLWQEEGQLKFKAPKGALTSEVKTLLTENKDAIITFLRQVNESKNVPPIVSVNRKSLSKLPPKT